MMPLGLAGGFHDTSTLVASTWRTSGGSIFPGTPSAVATVTYRISMKINSFKHLGDMFYHEDQILNSG